MKKIGARFALALVAITLLATLPASAGITTPTLRRPCDPMDPSLCLLPFPNDRFTRSDPSTPTGRRVDFLPVEMPRNIAGKPIDPTEWNRNDGFSPGSMVITFVPGLDLHQTWGTAGMTGDPRIGGPNDPRDHVADISRYLAADAPIMLIDSQTGQRWPFWSELDTNASTKANERLLIIRPAVNFTEGHTYLVGLRSMKDATGKVIPAGPEFAAYRDNTPGPAGDLNFEESRRADVNRIIGRIETAERARGNAFDRSQLFLAWQFTIASERNLTERVLHIRDDAFAQLGDTNLADGVIQGAAPRFSITSVTNITGDPRKQRQVDGTITVPNYLDGPPQPIGFEEDPVEGLPNQALFGTRFLYGADGLPVQNPLIPTIDVPFVCTIPKVATADSPAHPTLYGHGLLGSRGESQGGSTDRDRERDFMPCAVNWMGFAQYDVANALKTLVDPSNMSTMADRSQQGFLNFLYLGRALAHPQGLATNAAFKDSNGQPLFKTNELFYDGNSQGGIMGGALCALSVDLTRCVLGVTGMNYSTLLNHSSDWEGPLVDPSDPGLPSYSSFLYTAFPNKMEQQLVMALIQMLWDRAEADGYAEHMTTDPLPNTPAHHVLMHVALGDWQVTNYAAEVEARTIGARVMQTALMSGRHWTVAPTLGTEPFPGGLVAFPTDDQGHILPWEGSGLVYWDAGNLTPPNGNVPPAEVGNDPHEIPRRDPNGADQKATFWLTGQILDVMNGQPYLACPPGFASQIPEAPAQFNGFDWCQ
jgi:hypothetical protein